VALSSIFPEECNELRVAVMNTHEKFRQELTERQDKACEDTLREEASLQCALRDAVVEDVMKLFPWVLLCVLLNTVC
jgi:hypothetical protein